MANGSQGAPPSRANILAQLGTVPDPARTNPDIPSDADVNLAPLGGAGASLRPLSPGEQMLAAAARRHMMARMLSSQGQNGDTMLAHINPQEAMALRMMGGSGTRNPATGLPEFYEGDVSGGAGGGDPGAGGIGGSVGRDSIGGMSSGGGNTDPNAGGIGGPAGRSGIGGDGIGGDGGGGGGGGGASAIAGPLAGSPIDVTDPTFSGAMQDYQSRGIWEHLGELALPGYEAKKPVPEDPTSYAGGTYHTDVNPAAIAGGLIGSALAGPVGGFIGGRLLGAGYNALGGPTISGASLGNMFGGGGTPSTPGPGPSGGGGGTGMTPTGLATTAALAASGAPGTPSDMSSINPHVNAAYGLPAGTYPLRMDQTRKGQKSQQQQDKMYRLARLGLLMQANRAV